MKTTSTKPSEAFEASVKKNLDMMEISKKEIKEYQKLKSKLLKQSFVFTHKDYVIKHFPQYFI